MKTLPDHIRRHGWVPLDEIETAIGPMHGSGQLPPLIRAIYNASAERAREGGTAAVTFEFSIGHGDKADHLSWKIKEEDQ